MGIEPTRSRANDPSTALKAAEPTRRPDTPSGGRQTRLISPTGSVHDHRPRRHHLALRLHLALIRHLRFGLVTGMTDLGGAARRRAPACGAQRYRERQRTHKPTDMLSIHQKSPCARTTRSGGQRFSFSQAPASLPPGPCGRLPRRLPRNLRSRPRDATIRPVFCRKVGVDVHSRNDGRRNSAHGSSPAPDV